MTSGAVKQPFLICFEITYVKSVGAARVYLFMVLIDRVRKIYIG